MIEEMSGDRPDYEVDIFNLLLDLVDKPTIPTDNIYQYIELALLSLIIILVTVLLCKPSRIQYTVGKPI